jgi:hypothetical protein
MLNEPTNLSRRALLAVSAAAAATTAAPVVALAAANPDAELLRLDREHDVAYARSLRAGAGPDGLDDDDFEEICEALHDVEHAIHRIPAQALAGLAVKARLASVYFNPNPEDPPMMGIVQSLVEDILRMANATPSIRLPCHTRPKRRKS